MIIFEIIDKVIRAIFTRTVILYYRIRFGWGLTVGRPVKIFGNRKNIIIKGKAGINAFCVIGAREDGKIVIGNNVSISSGSVLVTHGLDTSVLDKKRPHKTYGDIVLEDNVWICSNVTVLGGVRIGRNSVVASGSVVTKDVPEDTVVGGSPAKIIKKLR